MSTRDDDALLEIQAVRRRQLATAALHGSTRSWMSGQRRWPAALAGILAAALILLGVGITSVVRAELSKSSPAGPNPGAGTSTSAGPTGTPTPTRSAPRTATPTPTRSTTRTPTPSPTH